MGKPGSGKSTLISLLFHLFPVEEGQILIDGHNINQIPLKILRQSIGYVPQDSFLFSDTITNNIGFGLPENKVNFEEVVQMSKIASVFNDIMNFSDKFDTKIGERGITLSGGQKQRVSISRALMINPNILILDDALSSVDASTEKQILKSISSEIKKRTSIIIAHRVSTVKNCDNIIVFDNGIITEHGTHKQLLELDKYYAKYYKLQKLEDKLILK
ncbi:unnamed protein product [marine sediment metagenome]|uniref:ABC transporter domain-containing protein n=1 Tax=marine sediment metagenome TaxID=412755 RepID=X0YD72_9ZZZZ